MPEHLRPDTPAPEGKVAVFWLFRSQLILKRTDLDEAEPWGQYLNAPGHEAVWMGLQRQRRAPAGVEYDAPPRGRVVFDSVKCRFYLYADRCTLARPELVDEILRNLNLPVDTDVRRDEHYRCAVCKGKRR